MDPLPLIAQQMLKSAGSEAGGVINNLLGPVTDEMGHDLLDKYRKKKAKHVAELAEQRSSNPEHSISLRVASAVFQTSLSVDDELMTEYLSGVLASSKSETGRDDRAIPWTAMISRLSSEQLRLHFLLYSVTRRLLSGRGLLVPAICDAQIFVPFFQLNPAMEWGSNDVGGDDFAEAFYGLLHENLVDQKGFFFGPYDYLRSICTADVKHHGLLFHPSRAGIGLFLWGLGHGREDLRSILDTNVGLHLIEAEDPSRILTSAALTAEMPTREKTIEEETHEAQDDYIRRAVHESGLPLDEWMRIAAVYAAEVQFSAQEDVDPH